MLRAWNWVSRVAYHGVHYSSLLLIAICFIVNVCVGGGGIGEVVMEGEVYREGLESDVRIFLL